MSGGGRGHSVAWQGVEWAGGMVDQGLCEELAAQLSRGRRFQAEDRAGEGLSCLGVRRDMAGDEPRRGW